MILASTLDNRSSAGSSNDKWIDQLSWINFCLIGGLMWTFWGFARLRTLAFPFLLLLTMVPPPSLLYPSAAAPLQLFASGRASALAQALGITVFRDGNIIHLANLSLGVVEACSG